jgi:hypothetical protein
MSDSKGVVYIAFGEKAQREYQASLTSLRKWHDWPVKVVTEIPENMTPQRGSRWAKLRLNFLSPFDDTLYLDADTRPRGDLSRGFKILGEGWDLALTPSLNQGGEDLLWHIDEEERDATFLELGYRPLQLQAGVMYFKKTEAIDRLFSFWRWEWERYQDQDQAALLRALRKSPVKAWLLGRDYNGGALLSHIFGRARA